MDKTLAFFSVLLTIAGSILIAFDILKPSYLKATRKFLLDFSITARKAPTIPIDTRVIAYRKTWHQFLSSKKPTEREFKEAYIKNLKEMNYETNFNLNFNYRSFVYIVTAGLLLIGYAYTNYKLGITGMFSLEGLNIFGVYFFINIGLMVTWSLDMLSEKGRVDDKNKIGFPPIYKRRIFFGSHRNLSSDIILIFSFVQILTNILAKIFAITIGLSFYFEKYTKADQGPRVVGFFLLLLAAIMQGLAIFAVK